MKNTIEKKELEHFKITVPENIKTKLKEFSETIDLSDLPIELHDSEQINEISGKSYDGFIAFQRGGYEISAFADNGHGSGSYLTKKQAEFMEKCQSDCEESFKNDNDIKEITEEHYDDLSEYESEWFEPALLRVETWIEDDSDDVYFRLSLGYKDAPYYRTAHDETIKEFSMSFDTFLKTENQEIINKLLHFSN